MIEINLTQKKRKFRKLSPSRIFVIGFLSIIFLGGTLLLFPISRQKGYDFCLDEIVNSYFTAVSATCVTGLLSCDTATTWSGFGQAVILFMIQIGGLGFMSMTVFFTAIVRKRLSPKTHTLVAQSYNLSSESGLARIVRRILLGTFITETVGACLLMARFIPLFGVKDGVWFAFFHSISSFCNAGFDLFGEYHGPFTSLDMFKSDPYVLFVIGTLIFIGGIGFIVWDEMIEFIFHKKRLSVYTRFVLIISAVLLCAGSFLIFIGEFSNPETLGSMNFIDKLVNSYFQSVTTRTAGYDAMGNAYMRDFTKMICIMLMFVGGASGSTAGGVKVSTFGLLLYTVYSTAVGKTQIVIFKRRISHANVFRAMTIVAIGFALCMCGALVIDVTTGAGFIPALYESSSAFATVGLSVIGTPSLSNGIKLMLMTFMFFGRVGVLTVTYALLTRLNNEEQAIKYSETNMLIG